MARTEMWDGTRCRRGIKGVQTCAGGSDFLPYLSSSSTAGRPPLQQPESKDCPLDGQRLHIALKSAYVILQAPRDVGGDKLSL